MPDPTTLSEKNRAKLDGIVQQMVENKESDDNIKFVVDDFKTKYAEKKNPVGTSTATTPKKNSESAPKTGSSVSKNTQGFPKIDTNGIAPNYEDMKPAVENPVGKEKRLRKELANVKVTPENMDAVMADTDALSATIKSNQKAKEQARSKRVKELETSFYDATQNDEDDAIVEQRLNDAVQKNGVWNNIKNIAKKAYNTTVGGLAKITDESGINDFKVSTDPLNEEKELIKKQAFRNKEKLTDTEINQRAQELFKEKEKENLFLDRANSFLDNMDDEDKNLLKQDRANKTEHLAEDNQKRLKIVSAMRAVAENKISDYKKIESELTKLKENGQPFPEDLYNQYSALGTEIKNIGSQLQKNEDYILKNKKDLGTAQQEFDLFKREYGDLYNFGGNVATSAGELIVNTLSGLEYVGTLGGNLVPTDKEAQEDFQKADKYFKETRETLRKPVESVESIEGFVNYASDLMANQIPNLVATSTGAKGLTMIGTASAGKKFTEMNEEVRQGKASYSPLQMAVAPLLYGSAEVISEIPTLSILKKGGRVLESVARGESELIKKTAQQKATEWAKDYGIDMSKEMAGEQFTNFSQNFNNKYILGKKDVGLLDNTGQVFKDTFTLTSILKAAPQTFGVIVKPFQSKSDLGTLDENSRKIIEFSKQLNTEGLSETEKTVIQKQIDKITADSSKIVSNTIGKITDMPGELYDEVVLLNSKAGEIKAQAREINEGNLTNKTQLLEGLAEDYKALQEKRNGIIGGSVSVVDVLPLKEQETLKKQAMEDLVTELNPDGKKNMTITNEQVMERANEIYAEAKANTASTEPQTASTEPTSVVSEESNKTQTSPPSSSEVATPSVSIPPIPEDYNIVDEKPKTEGNSPLLASETQETGSEVDGNLPLNEDLRLSLNDSKEVADEKIRKTEAVNLSLNQNTDESTPTTNPPADGNVRSGTGEMAEVRTTEQENPAAESISETVDGGTIEADTKVKPVQYKASEKGKPYDVVFENGELKITDENGKPPSAPTRRMIEAKHAENFDFTKGETALNKQKINDVSTWKEDVAAHSDNPVEVAETLLRTYAMDASEGLDTQSKHIAEAIGGKGVERSSFAQRVGKKGMKDIPGSLALQYFAPKGKGSGLDIIAQNAEIAMYGDWDSQNPRITEDDVLDFINDNPRGTNDYLNSSKKEKINALKTAFTDLTGLPANDKYLKKAIDQGAEKEFRFKNEEVLYQYSDEDLVSLSNEFDQFIIEENGKSEKTSKVNGSGTPIPDKQNQETSNSESRIQETRGRTTGTESQESGVEDNEQYSTQDRVSELSNERISPEKRSPKNTPKKLPEIIKDVAKKLKANVIYSRGRRRNSLGSYNPSNAVVKIGRAGDLDTVAHEIGHFLDDSLNILGNIPNNIELAVIRQLKWFSQRGGSNPPSQLSPAKKLEYLEREGLAEFIRAYIANPTQAKLIAPELFDYFEKHIGPETTNVLKEFSDNFIDFANSDAGDRMLANVESLDLKDKNGFIEWIKSFQKTNTGKILLDFNRIDNFRAGFTNAMHHAEKAFIKMHEAKGIDVNDITSFSVDKNFNYLNSMYRTASSSIFNKMKYGLLDSKGKQIKDGDQRVNMEYLFSGLDTTSPKTILKDINDVVKLLIAQRTLEYAKKFERTDNLTGIGGGINKDIDVAQEHLNDFNSLSKTDKSKFDRITEGARRYRVFADSVLDIAVEKGLISPENLQDIRKVNEFYAALNRTKESAPTEELLNIFTGSGNALNSVQAVIKKAKGGSDFIQNPYTSLLINSANILKQGDKNQVLNSFFQPLKEMRDMGDGAPIVFSEIAIPAVTGDKETITIFNKGKKEVWRITNKPIYEGLKSLNKMQDNFLLDLAALPADLIRLSVTKHIVFGLRNAYRDTFARLTESRSNSGFSDFNYSKEDLENFRTYGGSQEMHYLTDKKFHAKTIKEATKKLSDKGNIVLNPLKIAKAYGGFLSKTEEINRVAEFKSSFEYAKNKGLNDHEARLYAAYQAKDLMDFTRGGDTIRALNRIMPFLNAKVQGLSRAKKAIKENPTGFIFKQGVYMAVPTIIAAFIRSQMGDDDEYEELPAYQKDLFWNFKTPFTGEAWICLPKPHELGLPSSFLDRTISLGNGYEDAFDGFGGSASKTISVMDETSILGGLKPLVEVMSNKDYFRDKMIIPAWEQDLMMEKRKGTKYASNIGKGISAGLEKSGWKTDPRNVDHLLKGYGTYFADWAMAISDIGEKDSRNKFGISKTGFAKDQAISNSKSVMEATELAKELGKMQSGYFKSFKSKIEDSYEMEEGPEKQKLIKEIYSQAKEIIKKYKADKETVLNKKTPN